MLVADTVLVNYDMRRATRLYVDHGPVGIGATVAQRFDVPGQTQPDWRPVTHNSRTLTKGGAGLREG